MCAAGEGSWAAALKARGVEVERLRLLSFEGYFETLTAAERGLGVAFGLFPITTEWVRQGRLAVPLSMRTPVEGGIYLAFRANDPRHALLTEIASWLREQYSALPSLPPCRVAGSGSLGRRAEETRRRSVAGKGAGRW
jgi:DNA-binding transcriptional LysR family regulator